MAEIQFTTSPKLQTYWRLFDSKDAESIKLLQNALLVNDRTIDGQTYENIGIIMDGTWIWIRVLQGINLDQENIDFVLQTDTPHGRRGKAFWDLLGGSFTFTNVNQSINATRLFTPKAYSVAMNTPVNNSFLAIAQALQSAFDYRLERLQGLQRLLNERVDLFKSFLADWKDEDKKQHPEKYAVIDPNDPENKPRTPSTFKAVANPDGTITVSNIVQGDLVIIDGATGLLSKDVTFTSVPLADGEHTISVKGQGAYSYADTIKVVIKVSVFSSPVQFAKNNAYLVLIVFFFALLVYLIYKSSKQNF